MSKKQTQKWPEVALGVVTAATVFVSVVCNHWAVAIGVVLLLTLANWCEKHLDEMAFHQEKRKAGGDDNTLEEGG